MNQPGFSALDPQKAATACCREVNSNQGLGSGPEFLDFVLSRKLYTQALSFVHQATKEVSRDFGIQGGLSFGFPLNQSEMMQSITYGEHVPSVCGLFGSDHWHTPFPTRLRGTHSIACNDCGVSALSRATVNLHRHL